ncbi:hypothetical protein [Streptosporangium sp. NPDC002524]|uniref:hypothetical protein n=1 Tax=Streptosporangium sp. NPDC002524 TaxID=3154537 RepID=UPI00332802D3
MTEPLSGDRLAEIEARDEAATDGLWQHDGPYCCPFDTSATPHMTGVITAGEERTPVLVPACSNPRGEQDLAAAVHARRDVRDLLAEVKRLTRELADLQGQNAQTEANFEVYVEDAISREKEMRAEERARCVAELRTYSAEEMDPAVVQYGAGNEGALATIAYAATMAKAARLLETGELRAAADADVRLVDSPNGGG